jgi:hypothetical protein
VAWDAPGSNGAPVLQYNLEMDASSVAGASFHEIYKGRSFPNPAVSRLLPSFLLPCRTYTTISSSLSLPALLAVCVPYACVGGLSHFNAALILVEQAISAPSK